jgi:acyl-ACP thioesterase
VPFPLVPLPASGRRLTSTWPVRLGDVASSGRVRLDAIARYLQDVAVDDAVDLQGDADFGWVVRRTTIEITRFPVLGEQLELTTWGSAIGSRWAERRTSITGARGARVETAALWIHVDPVTGRPIRHTDSFRAAYAEAVGGRTIGSRLVHADPGPEVPSAPGLSWPVRRSDLDVLDHVNNAVYWAVVEEVFDMDQVRQLPFRAEVEHRGGLDRERTASVLVDDARLWIKTGDEIIATALVGYADPATPDPH